MNGNSPGHSPSTPSGGPYAGSTVTPDSVVKSASRTRPLACASSYLACQRDRASSVMVK